MVSRKITNAVVLKDLVVEFSLVYNSSDLYTTNFIHTKLTFATQNSESFDDLGVLDSY